MSAQPGFWEEHYRSLDPAWGTQPNPTVLAAVDRLALPAGRAVDLGCGHGGDALELARRGWDVLAVDVSETATARVAEAAARCGLADRVGTATLDLGTAVPDGEFDLAVAAYLHNGHGLDRDALARRVAGHLTERGVLLVVDHASTAPWSWDAGTHRDYPTPDGTAAAVGLPAGWAPVLLERVERTATGPGGVTAPVCDNVVAFARR